MNNLSFYPLRIFPSVWALRELPRQFFLPVFLVVIGAVIAFPASYLGATNVMLGILLLPVAWFSEQGKRFNVLYFSIALIFAAISYKYSIRIFYFFSIAFFLLVALEHYVGKCNQLILFNILFMSPFFLQVSTTLGFPVRLALSKIAGNALQSIGFNVSVEGNIMQLNGGNFTVDDACMGLKMLSTSLLMAVFLLGVLYRRVQRTLTLGPLILFFVIVFGCNLFCNLFRIILLVSFNVGPEKSMHGIIGAACFLVYVMVPLYIIAGYIIKRYGNEAPRIAAVMQTSSATNNWQQKRLARNVIVGLMTALSIIILLQGLHLRLAGNNIIAPGSPRFEMAGFQSMQLTDGITQLKNDSALIYIKPIPEFFSGEHTPLICWKGSGYEFAFVSEQEIGEHKIYMGKLAKDGSTLVTAWWYSNGRVITIDQLDWRYRMLKGEKPFNLVNVTAVDENILRKEILTVFAQQYDSVIYTK